MLSPNWDTYNLSYSIYTLNVIQSCYCFTLNNYPQFTSFVMVLIASCKLEQVDTLINLALESRSVDEFVINATQLDSE